MLVLASTSPYRRGLLARLGLPFAVDSPGVDERAAVGESGEALALRLAQAKAHAVAARHPGACVIGSDQTCVAADGAILGKPGGADAAQAQLARLSGTVATFHTALCVVDARSGREWLGNSITEACFRDLQDDEIARYVARDQPLDCAGGFKVEALGIALFDTVRSDDPTALVGLPLVMLCRFLREAGVAVP